MIIRALKEPPRDRKKARPAIFLLYLYIKHV